MNWLPLLPFAFFFAWLIFSAIRRRKPCPDCGHSLPFFQSPLTKGKRQWLQGGCICAYCGCETDNSGAKITSDVSQSSRSMVIGVLMLALAALPAMAMIFILISRSMAIL
jgi:hypothetical protein